MTDTERRLAVVPSESIETYLSSGYARHWLQSYYNPNSFFTEVYLLSPREKTKRHELGMHVIPTREGDFRRRIRELGIDVVRAYGGYWACDLACNHKVSGVPTVVSVHDTSPKLLYAAIKRADVVFCMSQAVRNLVLTRFALPDRVWMLPNRVNFTVMRPYGEEELHDLNNKYPSKYRLLHVGRRAVEKNLDTLIRSLKVLGEEYCLLAVGKGDTDRYVRLAQQEQVQSRCHFIDALNNDDLARYYSWADCMCTPSRWEGFGIVFIEALACGAVVVTSGVAPMNEYITHMENGLLVTDFENPAALAETIRLACTDTDVRRTLKANARQSVERFEKSCVDALETSYYQKVLEMKEDGCFHIPAWRQALHCAQTDIKRLMPLRIRRTVRRALTGPR